MGLLQACKMFTRTHIAIDIGDGAEDFAIAWIIYYVVRRGVKMYHLRC